MFVLKAGTYRAFLPGHPDAYYTLNRLVGE